MHLHLCNVVRPPCNDFLIPAKKSHTASGDHVLKACQVRLFGPKSIRETDHEDIFNADLEALNMFTATSNKSN